MTFISIQKTSSSTHWQWQKKNIIYEYERNKLRRSKTTSFSHFNIFSLLFHLYCIYIVFVELSLSSFLRSRPINEDYMHGMRWNVRMNIFRVKCLFCLLPPDDRTWDVIRLFNRDSISLTLGEGKMPKGEIMKCVFDDDHKTGDEVERVCGSFYSNCLCAPIKEPTTTTNSPDFQHHPCSYSVGSHVVHIDETWWHLTREEIVI